MKAMLFCGKFGMLLFLATFGCDIRIVSRIVSRRVRADDA
jgi:hypothetical protein